VNLNRGPMHPRKAASKAAVASALDACDAAYDLWMASQTSEEYQSRRAALLEAEQRYHDAEMADARITWSGRLAKVRYRTW
jgi:hypothetical protein